MIIFQIQVVASLTERNRSRKISMTKKEIRKNIKTTLCLNLETQIGGFLEKAEMISEQKKLITPDTQNAITSDQYLLLHAVSDKEYKLEEKRNEKISRSCSQIQVIGFEPKNRLTLQSCGFFTCIFSSGSPSLKIIQIYSKKYVIAQICLYFHFKKISFKEQYETKHVASKP